MTEHIEEEYFYASKETQDKFKAWMMEKGKIPMSYNEDREGQQYGGLLGAATAKPVDRGYGPGAPSARDALTNMIEIQHSINAILRDIIDVVQGPQPQAGPEKMPTNMSPSNNILEQLQELRNLQSDALSRAKIIMGFLG